MLSPLSMATGRGTNKHLAPVSDDAGCPGPFKDYGGRRLNPWPEISESREVPVKPFSSTIVLPAIQRDIGVAIAAQTFIRCWLQVGHVLPSRLSLSMPETKFVMTSVPPFAPGNYVEHIVTRTAGHRRMARAADERVVAGSALHDVRTGTTDKLRAVIAADQNRVPGRGNLLPYPVGVTVSRVLLRTGKVERLRPEPSRCQKRPSACCCRPLRCCRCRCRM